jgi:predicted Fe-Mo cluster-binding NifX family protein
MKIAIPTNDKVNIFKRSGRAKGFLIVNISNGNHSIHDYRGNSHSHSHDHHHDENEHHDHSHKELVDSLSDCNYLVVNIIGKHFNHDITAAGIKVFKTDERAISDAIEDFKKGVLTK